MNQKKIFNKAHWKLTLVCTGITILILVIMSLSYLYISESSLKKNQFLSFQNSTNSFLANLEQQSVISHDWLTQNEMNGGFFVELKDNGEDFLFNSKIQSSYRKEIFAAANRYFNSNFSPDFLSSYHKEFSFNYNGKEFLGSCGNIVKAEGILSFTIIFPLQFLEKQIKNQRMVFCFIDGISSLFLTLFAFYFTGRIMKPLEENQKNQSQFIASVSHELRTPLAVILSCAAACEKADSDEKTNFLHTIQSEGTRMSRLLSDMLTLIKTDNHSFTIAKTTCEPDTILLNSYEAFELLAKEKGVQFSVHLPDEMGIPRLLDKERIMQVLSILIHNALSYTPAGGTVELSMSVSGKHVKYIVSDNGIGIPDKEKKHIFKRFYRISQSRSEKEHFGLGLCIASEIVHAHHGKLTVTDTPAGGSTFCISLPV